MSVRVCVMGWVSYGATVQGKQRKPKGKGKGIGARATVQGNGARERVETKKESPREW